MASARVVSVNVVHALRDDPGSEPGVTAIDKRAVAGPVPVRAGGVDGDRVMDTRNHGGRDKAVYAYACEDLAYWSTQLGRTLTPGMFGENLSLAGLDVTGAVIGERWRVGDGLHGALLEVTQPRTPCATFQRWLQERAWVRRFTAYGAPGAYLRVVEEGAVAAGDSVEVVSRPAHGVTVGQCFRPREVDAAALERLLEEQDLAPDLVRALRRDLAARRRAGAAAGTSAGAAAGSTPAAATVDG